jgi:hypothetical protein
MVQLLTGGGLACSGITATTLHCSIPTTLAMPQQWSALSVGAQGYTRTLFTRESFMYEVAVVVC